MSELKSGRGEVVSRAGHAVNGRLERRKKAHTSPVVELRRDADTGSVLGRKRKVGFSHGAMGWLSQRLQIGL